MKTLLIGATGQVGCALTKAMSRTAHQTSVLVRNRRKQTFPANIKVLESCVFTADAFGHALDGAECVIYGVGLPEQFTFDNQVFQDVNYGLFRLFLDALESSSVRRLVYISTFEVFQSISGVIRESHPIANQGGTTPYFKAMIQAYQMVVECAETMGLALTTIHPAAVYGGINTGDGFTAYIENLLNRRLWRVPVIVDGRFPIVHVDSLAAAVVQALDKPGAYIVSDQMTSLQEIALTLREHARSYIPPTIPLWLARGNTVLLEFFARRLNVQPIMAQVQLEFISKGLEPQVDRACAELGWQPLCLRQGIQKYLQARGSILRQNGAEQTHVDC
jgi:nucleoside-diphosphate-sugar epimerase